MDEFNVLGRSFISGAAENDARLDSPPTIFDVIEKRLCTLIDSMDHGADVLRIRNNRLFGMPPSVPEGKDMDDSPPGGQWHELNLRLDALENSANSILHEIGRQAEYLG